MLAEIRTGSRSGERACSVRVAAYLDDSCAFHGEDLVEVICRRGARTFGGSSYREAEHDGVSIDFHALHGRGDPLGEERAIPVQDLRLVLAKASAQECDRPPRAEA